MFHRSRRNQVVGLALSAVAVSVFMWAKLRLVSGMPKTAYAEKEQPATNPPRQDPAHDDMSPKQREPIDSQK